MEINGLEAVPHSQSLEALFAYRSKVSKIFKDILGLHEISHIAITQVNEKRKILSFSSTPAMEYNLFSSNLWRFDKSYHMSWISTCSQADWQSLYILERYDELYYLKQIKPQYPIGYSLATKLDNNFFVYFLASHYSCSHTREFFANQHDEFYRIGQYCAKLLKPLFQIYEHF